MDTFVPDAEHINALPEPVRSYIRDLETRADPAGDVAELALLKENNTALWKRVQELEAEVNGLRGDSDAATPDLAVELQRIYDSEINMQIGWLWDGGVEICLGDDMNGYEAVETLGSVAETLPWLQEAIARFYPDSTYASSLGPEIGERAKTRDFEPARVGARAFCPYCGAPNAKPMMDELFAFVCSRCGASVTIDPPKVQ